MSYILSHCTMLCNETQLLEGNNEPSQSSIRSICLLKTAMRRRVEVKHVSG